MNGTKRGLATRQRILEVAAEAFAERGFRGTTLRHVCECACANVAAVKYHFGSKEQLYIETFRFLFIRSGLDFSTCDGLAIRTQAEWERALRDWAHRVLDGITGESTRDRCRSRLFLWERALPSRVLPLILAEFLLPIQTRLEALLRMGLPQAVSPEEVTIWRIATVAQCTVFASRSAPWEDLLVPRGMPRAQWLARMAEQVAGSVTCRLRFRSCPAPPLSSAPVE